MAPRCATRDRRVTRSDHHADEAKALSRGEDVSTVRAAALVVDLRRALFSACFPVTVSLVWACQPAVLEVGDGAPPVDGSTSESGDAPCDSFHDGGLGECRTDMAAETCFCATIDCTPTYEHALASLCAAGYVNWVESFDYPCGMLGILASTTLGDQWSYYDKSTRRLTGAAYATDTGSGCNGRGPGCASTACVLECFHRNGMFNDAPTCAPADGGTLEASVDAGPG
jgi:hypothetical protein